MYSSKIILTMTKVDSGTAVFFQHCMDLDGLSCFAGAVAIRAARRSDRYW